MQIQSIGASTPFLALQSLSSIWQGDEEETQNSSVAALTTRTGQVTLSAWSITISRQTTALIDTNGDLSLSADSAEEQKSPREQIADMAELVAKLKDEGQISERRARHIEKVLDLAAKALDHGRGLPAARLMRHLARVVDKLADRGKMPREAAAELIGSARAVVDQLREDVGKPVWGDVSNRAGVMLMVSEFRLTVSQVSVS